MTLATLAVLLVSISLWCLLLLTKSLALRQDLRGYQASLDDLHRLRAVLERPFSDVVTLGDWPRIEGLGLSSRPLADHPSEALNTTARGLSDALGELHRAVMYAEADAEPTADERVWDTSFTALKAVSALEGNLREEIGAVYGRLDLHWRSLNSLLVVCLLLCASNLGLLHLAHRRRRALENARDRALRLSSHDALTGLWNRDAILQMVRREISRARRLRLPLGLILADVDDFREVNGLVGQDQGDLILQEVAWRLGALVRPYDTMGRLGGDSFLVVLPTCDAVATANVTERLRQAIHGEEVEYGLGRLELSMSFVHLTVDTPEETGLDLVVHRLQEGLARVRDERGAVLAVSGAPHSAGVQADDRDPLSG